MTLPRKHETPIGTTVWITDHVSYKAWCDLARSRGWNGEDDADGLREYADPEEAAARKTHTTLDAAKAYALAIFAAAPDDSAFGAVLIEERVLTAAHDDRGNPVRGCPPEWDHVKTYEITSDGDCLESAS